MGAKVRLLCPKTMQMRNFTFNSSFLLCVKLFLFFIIYIRLHSTYMHKTLNVLLAVFMTTLAYGQTDSLTKEDRLALDSMFKNDEFIKLMMGTGKHKSYVDMNLGIGNGIFSLKNNSLNADQAVTSKLFYTGSAGYHHKSGLSLTVNSFMANDEGKLKMYQYAISPAYMYYGKTIEAGISYTRFFEGTTTSFDVTPFKNDFYANFSYKKTWIEPGLAVGFSFGSRKEYFDTAFWLLNRVVHIRDTITTKLSGLSAILSATHEWNFYKLLSRKDAIQLQPSIMLNAGSQRWTISHSSSLNKRRPAVQNYIKSRYGDGTASESFNLQSIGFLAAITYYYGKFYFQPQLYLDYYLPSTTGNRLASLFSVVTGFSF